MSGRFPKCLTPGCRRLLFRKIGSQQLTCGGCHQTFHVDDIILAEQNASSENTTFDLSSQPNATSSDDDMRQQFRTSSYPIINQEHPNALESSTGHNRHGSETSSHSKEYVTEKEKSTKLEKTIVPPSRLGTYNGSASSRSISSDEGGSTVARNMHAVSRRTHRRGISTASTAESIDETQSTDGKRYDVNYEEEKIRPGFSEINYCLNEFELDQQVSSVRDRIISEDETERREAQPTFYEKFSHQIDRESNPSFDSSAFFRDIPFRYNPKSGEEVKGPKPVSYESNYHLNQPKINQSSRDDFIDDYGSVQGSIVSEEDIEERAYPSGRNSYASFDGSTSSRSLSSSDDGGFRSTSGKLLRSQRTHRSHDNNTYEGRYSPSRFNKIEKNDISREQSELNDLVNELAKIGLTREKLLMVLLKQTETSLKEETTHQNRNTRSLVRKLSVQIPPTKSPDSASGSSKGGKRRSAAHHCRPLLGGTPFVTCQYCSMLLQLPIGMPNKRFVRIRCGECSEMQVCLLPSKGTTYNPLHKALGYGSARILMAPSRQFSQTDNQ